MLFVLTGDVQTGKTRWLERVVTSLGNRGVSAYGVLAPGVWADRRDAHERSGNIDANGFEKLGIDNVLLPQGERIAFARRADLAAHEGTFDTSAQSARAKLGWHIADSAIDRVNGHFSTLCESAHSSGDVGLLVIDELGRLELERDGGLTEAVCVLEAGPTPEIPHALIVVREALLPRLDNRFASWGKRVLVKPDEASSAIVLAAFD